MTAATTATFGPNSTTGATSAATTAAALSIPPSEDVADMLLYVYAQSFYHQLGPSLRQYLVDRFKKMRPRIIEQAYLCSTPAVRDALLNNTYSPAMFPDRPGAPPDLPEVVTWYLDYMDATTARLGLDPNPLQVVGWVDPREMMRRLDWCPIEERDQAAVDAFHEGVQFAAQVQSGLVAVDGDGDGGSDGGGGTTDGNGVLSAAKQALLAQWKWQGKHGLDEMDDKPAKRAHIDSDSDSSSSGDSPYQDPFPEIDLDVADAIEVDAGAGTGMLDLPVRTKARPTFANDDGNVDDSHWHKLAYKARLHKLGPGMTRESQGNIQGAVGAPPRFATWDEADLLAPDDYAHCRDYFDWEMKHGRAAPAVLPRDQTLAVVPGFPVLPLRPRGVTEPKLPPGPVQPDDVWPPEQQAVADADADAKTAAGAGGQDTKGDMKAADGDMANGDKDGDGGMFGLGWLWDPAFLP